MGKREREVLTKFIELYCDFPCLWDTSSELYKDRNKKSQCWQLLAEKLRDLEPAADGAFAKRKIDHMRSAYKRESKKVKESKSIGSGTSDVHVPNLWYFNLLKPVFENNNEEPHPSQAGQNEAKKRFPKDRGLERKKLKLNETAQESLQKEDKKSNSFAIYVGEQLEQVDTFQRQVAEKLISDVLFLAKTGNLHFDTRIESPSGTHGYTCNSQSHSPQYILPSLPSPKYTRSSTSSQYIRSSPSPQYIRSSPSTQTNQPSSQFVQRSSSGQFIPPSPAPQVFATKNEGIANLSIPDDDSSRTPNHSSPQIIMSSPSPQSIQTSSSQFVQLSSAQIIQPSTSQSLPTNNDDGIVHESMSEGGTSSYSENTEPTLTSDTINKGPANSILLEMLSK